MQALLIKVSAPSFFDINTIVYHTFQCKNIMTYYNKSLFTFVSEYLSTLHKVQQTGFMEQRAGGHQLLYSDQIQSSMYDLPVFLLYHKYQTPLALVVTPKLTQCIQMVCAYLVFQTFYKYSEI